MTTLEEVTLAELAALLRAGAPTRAVRLTVRELVISRIERGPLGPREVTEAVEAMVRAACRLVREAGASDELVETVCRATVEAVRGHGGESARWVPEAMRAASAVLEDLARERDGHATWWWVAGRLSRW